MKYRLRSPIRHGGKRIEPPAVVELTLVEAAPLLAAGVIERAADTPHKAGLPLMRKPSPTCSRRLTSSGNRG